MKKFLALIFVFFHVTAQAQDCKVSDRILAKEFLQGEIHGRRYSGNRCIDKIPNKYLRLKPYSDEAMEDAPSGIPLILDAYKSYRIVSVTAQDKFLVRVVVEWRLQNGQKVQDQFTFSRYSEADQKTFGCAGLYFEPKHVAILPYCQ